MAPTVVGSPVRLKSSFYDSTGTAVDPTSVTVTVTLPDGTTSGSLAASKDSVGNYHYDYTPTQVGIHQFYFTGTGANAAIQPADIFTVLPLTTGNMISLADAKEQLNKAPTSSNPTSTDDSEILGFIAAASEIASFMSGYTVVTSFSEFLDVGWGDLTPTGAYASGYVPIVVGRSPLIAVQSIVPQFYNAAPADISHVVLDKEAGIIWLPTTALFLGPCLVTYTAGRPGMVPIVLQEACRIIVQHLWETQRGPSQRPRMGGEELVTVPGMGYAIPDRAAELLENTQFNSAPGFA